MQPFVEQFEQVNHSNNQETSTSISLNELNAIIQTINVERDINKRTLHLLEPHMENIINITQNYIKKGCQPSDFNSIINIWQTITEIEEQEFIKQGHTKYYFVKKSANRLLTVFLITNWSEYINNNSIDNLWNIIQIFFDITNIDCLSYILPFISTNINNSNIQLRFAALCGICALSKTFADLHEHHDQILMIGELHSIIIRLMNDNQQQIKIRILAAWTLGCIAEHIPNIIVDKDILQSVVVSLDNNNEKEILDKICWAISEFVEYYWKHTMTETFIHKENNAFDLINKLLSKRDNVDSLLAIHETINNVIYYTLSNNKSKFNKDVKSLILQFIDEIILFANQLKMYLIFGFIREVEPLLCTNSVLNTIPQMINYLIMQYFQYYDIPQQLIKSNTKTATISSAIAIKNIVRILTSLQILVGQFGAECLDVKTANDMISCCYLPLQFNNDTDLYEESLGCITNISRCIGDKFMDHLMTDNMQKLLFTSMIDKNESILRVGVNCIGDVYTACNSIISLYPEKIKSYTDRILNQLSIILMNTNISISSKSHVIDAFDDILLSYGNYAQLYSSDILDKCLKYINMNAKYVDRDNENDVQCLNELRCSIIDLCRSCIASLATANMMDKIKIHVPKLNVFIKQTANDENISVDVFKSSIKLLSDAVDYLDAETIRQFNISDVNCILNEAHNRLTDINPNLAQQTKQIADTLQQLMTDS